MSAKKKMKKVRDDFCPPKMYLKPPDSDLLVHPAVTEDD